jgi:hypothetical protein
MTVQPAALLEARALTCQHAIDALEPGWPNVAERIHAWLTSRGV